MKVCSSCRRCYDDSAFSCIEESHPIHSETLAGSCEMIAGYRLEFLSESGGRCTTFRARHTITGMPCFIRIITASEKDSSEFLREAQIAFTLFHPNVAGVHDADALDGVGLYVVSEDAGGQTLREHLNSIGTPPLLTAVQIVKQAAEALDAIHRSGLIHRSVTPENIVLTTGHDQQILVRIQNPDLGGVVGRLTLSDKFLIETALGSLRYFSPEQFSGKAITAQSDVYSLGVVFYEMLAGVPPFDSATAAGVIHKHRNEPPPDIRIDNFELRMLVTHSLMESLHKQPSTRTASAMALARQMRHIEQLATHTSTPPPAGTVPIPATVQQFAATVAADPPKPVRPVPAQPAVTAFKSAMDEDLDIPAVTAPFEIKPAIPNTLDSTPTADLVVELNPATVDEIQYQAAEPAAELEPANEPSEIQYQPAVLFTSEHGTFTVYEDFVADPIAAAEVEPQPATTLRTAGEPVHEISLVISVPDLPEPSTPAGPFPEAAAIENSVEEEKSANDLVPAPHRSRLKHRRRKLHTITPHAAAEVPEIIPVPEPAPPELTIVQIATDPIPAIQAEPETIEIAPVQLTPKVIEWELSEDDIPSLEEVMEVRMQENIAADSVVVSPLQHTALQEVAIEEPAIDEPLIDEPVIDEGIWQAEPVSTVAAHDFEFLASVVRQPEQRKSAEFGPHGSLFASYGAEAAARSNVGYKSLMIGGGFVAAMVLFLAGDVIVNEDARPQGTIEEAAVTVTAQKSQVPPAVARTEVVGATEQKPVKNFKPPADAMQADRTNPAQPNVETPASSKPAAAPSAEKEEASSEPPIIVGARRNGGRPPVRSTLVISSDKGRIQKKVESDKASAETRSPSEPDKAASGTRPRIVVGPR